MPLEGWEVFQKEEALNPFPICSAPRVRKRTGAVTHRAVPRPAHGHHTLREGWPQLWTNSSGQEATSPSGVKKLKKQDSSAMLLLRKWSEVFRDFLAFRY